MIDSQFFSGQFPFLCVQAIISSKVTYNVYYNLNLVRFNFEFDFYNKKSNSNSKFSIGDKLEFEYKVFQWNVSILSKNQNKLESYTADL